MTAAAQTLPRWPEGVTLLLGLGAQKSGTTWLHSVLACHPACRALPVKEAHYFDTLAGIAQTGPLLAARKAAGLTRRGDDPAALARVERLGALLGAGRRDDAAYVALMTEGMAPGSVALDLTPAYGLVDEDTLRGMVALGPTRFVTILREPVARFWSAVRMRTALAGGDTPGFEDRARALADRFIAESRAGRLMAGFAQGDYAGLLARMARAVPPARRLVLFFETLFTQHTLDRVLAFLGLGPMALTDTAPRLQGQPATLRADQVARLTEIFRPQYQAVDAAFGAEVPQPWHARFAAGAAVA